MKKETHKSLMGSSLSKFPPTPPPSPERREKMSPEVRGTDRDMRGGIGEGALAA